MSSIFRDPFNGHIGTHLDLGLGMRVLRVQRKGCC